MSKRNKDDMITTRLRPDLAKRFNWVVEASKRSKTSIVEECLDAVLPGLQKRYAKMKEAA